MYLSDRISCVVREEEEEEKKSTKKRTKYDKFSNVN